MLRRIAVSAVRPIPRPPHVLNVRCKGGRSAQLAMPKMRPQQSHRIAAQELGGLPADLGLLPSALLLHTATADAWLTTRRDLHHAHRQQAAVAPHVVGTAPQARVGARPTADDRLARVRKRPPPPRARRELRASKQAGVHVRGQVADPAARTEEDCSGAAPGDVHGVLAVSSWPLPATAGADECTTAGAMSRHCD
jgi:hypothetical protein